MNAIKSTNTSMRAIKRLWKIIGDLEDWQHRDDVAAKDSSLVNPIKSKLIDAHNEIEYRAEQVPA